MGHPLGFAPEAALKDLGSESQLLNIDPHAPLAQVDKDGGEKTS